MSPLDLTLGELAYNRKYLSATIGFSRIRLVCESFFLPFSVGQQPTTTHYSETLLVPTFNNSYSSAVGSGYAQEINPRTRSSNCKPERWLEWRGKKRKEVRIEEGLE